MGSKGMEPTLRGRFRGDLPVVRRTPPPEDAGRSAPAEGGARAGQASLIAAVAVEIIWVLLRVSVVVLAVLMVLILAAAVAPVVRWLVARGWSHLLATLTAFLGILVVVGGVVTGVVLAIRKEWDSLVSSAMEGWQQLQARLASGHCP